MSSVGINGEIGRAGGCAGLVKRHAGQGEHLCDDVGRYNAKLGTRAFISSRTFGKTLDVSKFFNDSADRT